MSSASQGPQRFEANLPLGDGLQTRLLFSTVRVEAENGEGVTSVGTAYFFEFDFEDKGYDSAFLITNRHVIAGSSVGHMYFHARHRDQNRPSGSFYRISFGDFESWWASHPNGLDIAMMSVSPLRDHFLKVTGEPLYHRSLSESAIPSPAHLRHLNASQAVLMIGYPTGLWDKTNNLPLLRRGHTASHPAVEFNGKPEVFLDIAAFPGSSGSPVVVLNENSVFDTASGAAFGTRFLFLGTLYAGPVHMASGAIEIVEAPTSQVPVALTGIPMHLGIYIHSREVLAFKPLISFKGGPLERGE